MRADVVIVGGGIVGLATARALLARHKSVVVLEKEQSLGAHQTGRNSGVIHSGLYYKPGSKKALLCREGRARLIEFCEREAVPFSLCGKVVVATVDAERAPLAELRRRGQANGIESLREIGPEELREHEPSAAGVAALYVGDTGIVDYRRVLLALSRTNTASGAELRLGTEFRGARREGTGLVVETSGGTLETSMLVGCAGLMSDRVATLSGATPDVRIVPFRGEYYELVPERHALVRNLIYPVPNPDFPFLGVHFTRMQRGGVEAGPNAVLAFRREGYTKTSFSPRDTWATFSYPGFWTLARKYYRTGAGEFYRSWSKQAFVRALSRLVPDIRMDDLLPGSAGVRAQALTREGTLVDDFDIVEGDRSLHVLNAPSPAATASLAIGESIADRVMAKLSR